MKSTFHNVIEPMARRVGTFAAALLFAEASPEQLQQIETMITLAALLTFDLFNSYLAKKG